MWMILKLQILQGHRKKIHKVCAVYWTLANIPVTYRSVLHSTQLALLCNPNDVRQFGCEKVFAPLLGDLKTLEEVGVYIEAFGYCLKGTIGGNGHENHTLLRLLPVLIGSRVPEGDTIWEILMEMKDIVELAVSHSFTDNTIQYMASKT